MTDANQGARHAYRQQQAGAWTRIDMLLALYVRAEETLSQLAAGAGDAAAQRLKLVRLLLGIRQGLDFQHGELPQNIDRLCEFIQQQALHGGPDELASAQQVLRTLREAYQAIRDEAADLEASGQIPSAAADATWERLA